MPASQRVFLLCAFVLVLISASLRFYLIGNSSYWIDEMVSLYFSSNKYWGAIFWDNSPFLYHLLLKFWIELGGLSEAFTRSFSVIFSVATTALLIRFGYQIGGARVGLMCGLLHA